MSLIYIRPINIYHSISELRPSFKQNNDNTTIWVLFNVVLLVNIDLKNIICTLTPCQLHLSRYSLHVGNRVVTKIISDTKFLVTRLFNKLQFSLIYIIHNHTNNHNRKY